MSGARTIRDIIAEVVRRETRYLRHYEAQVLRNDDELNKGRILVAIPALARFSGDEGIWAFPRYPNFSQVTPPVDSWVEIYFMNGKIDRPVYLNGISELTDTKLEGYTGPTTHVLFEQPDGKLSIIYDSENDAFTIKVTGDVTVESFDSFKLGAGGEAFTLGTTLKGHLDALATYIDAHVHSGVTTGGGSSGPPGSPSPSVPTIESSKIEGE